MNFREGNARKVHWVRSGEQDTLCGKPARYGALWSDSDPNMDRKLWPVCFLCRQVHEGKVK